MKKRPLDSYLDKLREDAEAAAFEPAEANVAQRRKTEKFLAKRGLAGKIDDLTLKDFQKIRTDHPVMYSQLTEIEDFRTREAFLRRESEDALADVRKAGDEAVLAAGADVPRNIDADLILERFATVTCPELFVPSARVPEAKPRTPEDRYQAWRTRLANLR
jgi:hypothetical protein